MPLTSVSNSYLSQLTAAEKDPAKTPPSASQPSNSASPQQDSIQLSPAGLAALNSPENH
jgi:hypothetical protein